MGTKTQGPELEDETNFKGRCSYLEGYIFRSWDNIIRQFSRTTKDLERYLGSAYSDIYQTAIMTKTLETFPDPQIPTIATYTGAECPNTDTYMTYLKKKNIDQAIRQKLRKKYVYDTDMNNIDNVIVGQTNEQLQEKAESDATFQAVKTGRDAIGYLIILKKLCFSNQY